MRKEYVTRKQDGRGCRQEGRGAGTGLRMYPRRATYGRYIKPQSLVSGL